MGYSQNVRIADDATSLPLRRMTASVSNKPLLQDHSRKAKSDNMIHFPHIPHHQTNAHY